MKNTAISAKQRLLVKVTDLKSGSYSRPGYLSVQPEESFLLIDDVCGNDDKNALLVINRAGSVGYISSHDVEFLVAEEAEVEPFLESLIKHSFINDQVHNCKETKHKASSVKMKGKYVMEKFLILLENLKYYDPNFDADLTLKGLSHQMKGRSFGAELRALGPGPFTELAMHYLKDAFSKTGFSILKLLRVITKYNPCVSEYLIGSDFLIVLMMDLMYKRYGDVQVVTSLEILKSVFEINFQELSPQILDMVRQKFLAWLITELDVACTCDKFLNVATCLVITIYLIPSLTIKVVSKILSAPRTRLPRLLISLAKKHGIRSTHWRLLVDLLTFEGNEFRFFQKCIKDMVELIWCTKSVMEQNYEAYLKILGVLCGLPASEKVLYKREIIECLKTAYHMLPDLQSDIWALCRKINVDKQKNALEERLLMPRECHTMYIPIKLKAVLEKLEHTLSFVSAFEEEPIAMSHLEIFPVLRQCYRLAKSLDLTANYRDKAPHYVYNLYPIHAGLDAIDCIFSKFCTYDIQRLSILILSEMCSFFPDIITHALHLKMIPTLIKEITYFSNKDVDFFETLIITLTRLLCNDNDEPLPPAVSECLLEEFVVFLVERIEKREHTKSRENTVSLLLAINLYKTEEVVAAFAKTRCIQAVQVIKNFLDKGFDPLCAYNTTLDIFSPVKLYSDLLENSQTAMLVNDDCLQSILGFSIEFLGLIHSESQTPSKNMTMVSSSEEPHHVPENLRHHLHKILQNCLRHHNLPMSESGTVRRGMQLLSRRQLPIAEIQNVLHDIRNVFERRRRISKYFPRSESDYNFLLRDENVSCPVRKATSTHRM